MSSLASGRARSMGLWAVLKSPMTRTDRPAAQSGSSASNSLR